MPSASFKPEELTLHGHRVGYRTAGRGPVLLLLHGVANSSETWERVAPLLSKRFTLIAPDLLGHGGSAKPRGDYSLGAYASGIRDLLSVLDVPRATLVGHSLGGGIAMQFAYQFPERLERLVLVDSGGLGNEVSIWLRAATLPGSEYVLPFLFSDRMRSAGFAVGRALGRLGVRADANIRGVAEGLESLRDADARRAFVHTARSVIDPAGQRVDARDRLYLSEGVPTLLVWGERDPIIPVKHGRQAHELMPDSQLVIFNGAGHFPFNDDPERFAEVLTDFVATTEPAALDEAFVQGLLRRERGDG